MDEYVLYSRVDDHELILDSWGSSTKHPDTREYFSEWKGYEFVKQYVENPQDDTGAIMQWLVCCASKRVFPHHTICLVQFAMDFYNTCKKGIIA